MGTKLKSLQAQFIGTLHALRLIFIRRLRKNVKKATIKFVISNLIVRMEQLGPHWTEFHEIRYLNIFGKSVEKI